MFRETFSRDPEEVDFPYLFHVHGNGGVGKSTLVRQWETAAREQASVVTAFVDDQAHDALEAMETISARLGQQGHPLKKFDKQLATYRQRRHQAESAVQPVPGEPGAGELAPPSTSSSVVAQVGLVGLGMVPGVGAFVGAVDPQQVALGADRMRAMLNTRLRSHDDVQLVLDPVAALAPVFLEDLADVAERCERVVLFFDVHERTGPVLDAWLQSIIFREDHGSLPINVQIVLSGQLRLDTRVWGDHLGDITEVYLEVFTEEEARTLLATHGVTEEQHIELILRLSGRLPLLVDMLARSDPSSGDSIGDPSETAVERFLKWEPDVHRREAALACALPLQLDEDVYRTVVPEAAEDGYPWLRGLAFVSRQAGRCRYHDVVRAQMLRLQRTRSPAQWQQQHTGLADAFEQWRLAAETTIGTDIDEQWRDSGWREHRLSETYHRLCANPRTALPDALFQAVQAIDHDIANVRHWAHILGQAGQDTETPTLSSWSRRLETAGDQDGASINVLTLLLGAPELGGAGQALAHTLRARAYRVAGNYERALTDYAAAHRIAPDAARGFLGRGMTYQFMGCYNDAVTDYTRAIELNPQAIIAFNARAYAYRFMGRYNDAVTDYARAIELNPQAAWAIASRAETYRFMGRHDDALIDYARAIELNPQTEWVIASRARTYLAMKRYNDALSDYDRVIELNPQSEWGIAGRAATNLGLGRYDEAILDCARAIELDPEDGRNQRLYAVALRLSGGEEAGAYLQAAIQTYTSITTGDSSSAAMSARGELLVAYCTVPDWDKATAQLEAFLSYRPAQGLIHAVREDLSFFQELLPEIRSGMGPIAQRLQEALGPQS